MWYDIKYFTKGGNNEIFHAVDDANSVGYTWMALRHWLQEGPPKQVDIGLPKGSIGNLGILSLVNVEVCVKVFKNNELQTVE